MQQRRNTAFYVLILGALSAVNPFSIDMYLPGFPAIARDMGTNVARIQLSLTSFFIGISFGQLLYGPLLDRYGRKKPVYIGLIIYILTSIGCALTSSSEILIGMRFLQAIGGCAGLVAGRAMVRDLFPVSENARVFSLLMLVIAVSPMIAPTLGGYFASGLGWQAIFVFLAALGFLILLSVFFFLPESRQPDPTFSLKPRPIIRNFWSVIKNRQFATYAFVASISGAGMYAYISGSPDVYMNIYRVSEQHYGWIFAFIATGLITSSQINSYMLRRYTSQQIIRIALMCQSLVGLLLVLGTVAGVLNVYGMIALMFFYLCCQGFSFPNSSALSLAPFGAQAGSASALMGFFQMSVGALASGLVSVLSNNSAIPTTAVMFVCAGSGLILLLFGTRAIERRASREQVEKQNTEMHV
ncbi:MAG: multidrug effflux MFS transporter [Mucilaginibacter polytrichastri]|nr:multidrug effflux MFS transporter [Mucilaginibacter polytrichastri]